ncbi:MAG: hypothetical protein CR965_00830 [Paludibacter sp.]|nr:MAG: hypothetical protein CR965_00830 [Paludibacter sp.]
MRGILIIISILFFIISCEDNEKATITIKNNTSNELTNCLIYGFAFDQVYDSINFGNIKRGDKLTKIWKTDLSTVDGDIMFKYNQNAKERKISVAYFSNGRILDEQYLIEIDDEGIWVSTENSRYQTIFSN